MTILLLHNDASSNMAPDLQGAFGCTAQIKKLFGSSGLNFDMIVLDLNEISEDEIKRGAGSIAALCYALKSSKSMTKDKVKSVLELCHRDRKDAGGYREYASILSEYMFQTANYPNEVFYKIEQEVITNKEEQIMPSTYSRAIEEGMLKGIEKGRQEGRQEGMEKGLIKVALNLLKIGNIDIQSICKATGLSKQEVLNLQKA